MRFSALLMSACFLLSQTASLHSAAAPQSIHEALQGRMKPGNTRFKTFDCALRLMDARNVKTIVETGTTRGTNLKDIFGGDGGSTIIFADWASRHNAQFASVDIEPSAFVNSRDLTAPYKNNVQLVANDSVAFIENYQGTIDMLYLDSYDFDANDPLPSQLHHLKEIKAALPKLKDTSIILIDDCGLPHGGKGTLAIAYLKSLGWQVVINEYQVLLLKQL